MANAVVRYRVRWTGETEGNGKSRRRTLAVENRKHVAEATERKSGTVKPSSARPLF